MNYSDERNVAITRQPGRTIVRDTKREVVEAAEQRKKDNTAAPAAANVAMENSAIGPTHARERALQALH